MLTKIGYGILITGCLLIVELGWILHKLEYIKHRIREAQKNGWVTKAYCTDVNVQTVHNFFITSFLLYYHYDYQINQKFKHFTISTFKMLPSEIIVYYDVEHKNKILNIGIDQYTKFSKVYPVFVLLVFTYTFLNIFHF